MSSSCSLAQASGFVIALMRVAGLGEAVLQEDDHRIAGSAQRSADLFLALGDGGTDEHRTVVGITEAGFALGVDLCLRKAARALQQGALWALSEEHIPERSALDAGDHCLAANTEQVGVGALEPQPAGVVLDVVNHWLKLLG